MALYLGIVRCRSCDLVYFSEAVDTKALYGANYFHGGEYHDYSLDKGTLQRNFSGRVVYLEQILLKGRLLELGCAYGFFLELAAKKYEAQGIDISEDGVRNAKEKLGLNARHGDFLNFPDELSSYDVACLWDTIEHLPEPFQYLEKLGKWVKPGGHLVLTTGDFGSILARMRGRKWRQIHPPTHLFYFDKKTISRALEKAGFRVVEFSYVGQYRSYRSMFYELFCLRHPNFSWIYRLFTLNGRLDFPVYLNTFDIMQVTAQREVG